MVFLEAEDTTRFEMYLDNVTPSESDYKHFFLFVNCERIFFSNFKSRIFQKFKSRFSANDNTRSIYFVQIFGIGR